jgi:hypothetical protein
MSNVLVTLEYHRHGDTLCKPCPERYRNTVLTWRARLAMTGEEIVESNSGAPFFAAARVLLERGYDSDDMLYLVDVGTTDITRWRLRGKLGALGSVTTKDGFDGAGPIHLQPYKPRPSHPTPATIAGPS